MCFGDTYLMNFLDAVYTRVYVVRYIMRHSKSIDVSETPNAHSATTRSRALHFGSAAQSEVLFVLNDRLCMVFDVFKSLIN